MITEPTSRSYSDCCDWTQCTRCGQCLMNCPVMQMDENQAQKEISMLLNGERAPRVFNECTLCLNCNTYCPNGLRPHELILQRIIEGRKKGKVNAIIPYLINGLPQANFFDDIYTRLSPEENAILDTWETSPGPCEDLLLIGCVGRMSCYDIENSTVLKDLPKYGPRDLCCGELAYRMGSWQSYTDIADRAFHHLSRLECSRLVTYCGSCFNFYANIMPNVYGKSLPFEVISLYEWLWEKHQAGSLPVKNPIEFSSAIHESCYVSENEGLGDLLRNLYRAAGAGFVELPHNRDKQLSCGMISFARSQNPIKTLLKNQKIKYNECKEAGVKSLACNCPGCILTMGFTNVLFGVELRYMPDELLHAFGDELRYPLKKRLPMITGIMAKRLPFRALRFVDNDFDRVPLEGPVR